MPDPTLDFYNSNATTYVAGGRLNKRLKAFLNRCRPGGRILELGTGSGTDAKFMLDAGFAIDPTDGSSGLAAEAEALLGQPVRIQLFHELVAENEYDGIYASASLLHVQRADLPGIISRINKALKPGGTLWASFKSGTAEGVDRFGRYYNYLGAEELRTYWAENGVWQNIEIETWEGSGHDRLPTTWHGVTAIR